MTPRRDDRRRQILDAAFAVFIQYGYAKTTFDDVARKAEVSRSLLYAYFKDKEDLFLSAVRDCLAEQRRQSDEVLAGAGSREQKVLRLLEIWCVDLYAEALSSPHGGELIAEGTRAWDSVGVKYRDYLIRELGRLVGDAEAAELMVLSVRGLQHDHPSLPRLRRRVHLLAELCGRPRRKP